MDKNKDDKKSKRATRFEEHPTSIEYKIIHLEESFEKIRTDMFQTISIFVGLLGIIFSIIISTAFLPDMDLNFGIVIVLLLGFLSVLNCIWFILWLKKNFGKTSRKNPRNISSKT